MQHIEEAGIHWATACVLPPHKISQYHLSIIIRSTSRSWGYACVRGLMNVQYAIKGDVVHVLEVNPREPHGAP